MIKNISEYKGMRFRLFGAAIFFLALLLALACQKKDLIGLEVQPATEQLGLLFSDTSTVIAYTILEDSIRTDLGSFQLVGSYVDPEMGKAEAAVNFQLQLSQENPVFGTVQIDSVVLSMVYAEAYGTDEPMTFKVYQIDQQLETDSAYYSGRQVSTQAQVLGQRTGITNNFDASDSITIGSTKEPMQLRVHLSKPFGRQLLQLAESSSTNGSFTSVFNGLRVQAENSSQNDGEGSIISFILRNSEFSRVEVYYKVGPEQVRDPIGSSTPISMTPQQSYRFDINEESAVFSTFSHDYTGSPVDLQFSDTSLGNNRLFLQSMAGVKVKLRFPHFQAMDDSMALAINRAELVVEVEKGSDLQYESHTNLFVVAIGEDNKSLVLLDQLEGEAHYGGLFNNSASEYRFNITRHLQAILDGTFEDRGMYLVAAGAAVNAHRTILGGTNVSEDRFRLELSYTPL